MTPEDLARLSEIEARVEISGPSGEYGQDEMREILGWVKQLRARVEELERLFGLCIVPLEALRITDERRTYPIVSAQLRAAIYEATDATRAYAASRPTAEPKGDGT